jgi:Isochorismatase family
MSNIDEAPAMSGSAGPARGGEEAEQVLPDAGFVFDRAGAALVVIDPQNDFLSPDGAGWPVFGQSVTENKVVANLARLFEAAESSGMTVAISPHYEYPADRQWRFGGPGERLLNALHMFARSGPLTVEGLPGSGADFLEQFKHFILDGPAIIASPTGSASCRSTAGARVTSLTRPGVGSPAAGRLVRIGPPRCLRAPARSSPGNHETAGTTRVSRRRAVRT